MDLILQDEGLVTIKEISSLLNIAEKTIYKMAAEERIPAYKLGGSWRFSIAEVQRWLAEQHNQRRSVS